MELWISKAINMGGVYNYVPLFLGISTFYRKHCAV